MSLDDQFSFVTGKTGVTFKMSKYRNKSTSNIFYFTIVKVTRYVEATLIRFLLFRNKMYLLINMFLICLSAHLLRRLKNTGFTKENTVILFYVY